MAQKPSVPKGTRDFGPVQMAKRNYIFNTIRGIFELHGFAPIETPAMENLETLTGKYGEEGDQLIFKILQRGDKLGQAVQRLVRRSPQLQREDNELSPAISNALLDGLADGALRYDLTVPFARFVVQHRNDITFPFKRYQIQPVWRADRPQKGRYREFYQCDIDIIGSRSLWNEVELIQVIHGVYEALQLPEVTIKLNHRGILQGLAEAIGQPDMFTAITVALDKLDKLPREKVMAELLERGVSEAAVAQLAPLLEGPITLEQMHAFLEGSETGRNGLQELQFVIDQAEALGITSIQPEFTLARGLNYYTGLIFEVTHPAFPSSITGGGRYDDLTGIFGLNDMSGVGISFGADRIYDLLEQEGRFPDAVGGSAHVLFVNFGEAEAQACLPLLHTLRKQGISGELYPDSAKLKKQFKYANDKGIPWVVSMGTTEREEGTVTLKNMESGEQQTVAQEELIQHLGS